MRSAIVAAFLAVAFVLAAVAAADAGGKAHGKALAGPGKAKSVLIGRKVDEDRFRVVRRLRRDERVRVRFVEDADRDFDHGFRGLPPGLGKRHVLPPGLAKRTDLPPGLAKWHSVPPGLAKRIELPPGLTIGHAVPPGLEHQSGFSTVFEND